VFLTSACLAVFPLALFIAKKHPIDIAAAFGLRDVLASASFLQQLYPESLRFNGVYWTLVYEAGFYVCYPLLRQVTARWGMIPVATALFASEVILLFHPVPIPLFVLNKYFEWYLGFIAAEIFVRKTEPPSAVLKIGTLAFFALGSLSTMNARLYAFRDVIFCVAFFGLLLIVLNVSAEKARSRLHRVLMGVLENPLPVLIGSFSYSLYLIHVPLIDVIWQGTALAAKYGVVGSLTGKLILIGCVPALFPLAYIFYCRFERPFLRRAPG
jgi:peptidoglycan/LPS O-acetylase OafA/YrhL